MKTSDAQIVVTEEMIQTALDSLTSKATGIPPTVHAVEAGALRAWLHMALSGYSDEVVERIKELSK